MHILNRRLITRERFLEATEKVLEHYFKKEQDGEISMEFGSGVALAIERLKRELGYDKMIPKRVKRK